MIWLIPVAVVGGVAIYLLTRDSGAARSVYTPAPSSGAAVSSGGPRATAYLQRLNAALLAYQAVKLVGGAAAASGLAELKGTLDVVKGMAQTDLAQRDITQTDLNSITARVEEIKKLIV